MRHRLGVGVAGEGRALRFQSGAQVAKILDDAVMDHSDAIGRMRMRVVLGRLAMRRPAGVADADAAEQRRCLEARFQILQLALGAAAVEMHSFQRRDTGGIIAAIFQPLEGIHQLIRDRTTPQNANDAAHADSGLPIAEQSACLNNHYCTSADSIIVADCDRVKPLTLSPCSASACGPAACARGNAPPSPAAPPARCAPPPARSLAPRG